MGGELTAYRKLEVSEWRFTVGRSFIPTGDSGKASLDHVRVQYERLLTQRLTLNAAARYDSRNALGKTTTTTGEDRDYARAGPFTEVVRFADLVYRRWLCLYLGRPAGSDKRR
jgi:hypothetical protein